MVNVVHAFSQHSSSILWESAVTGEHLGWREDVTSPRSCGNIADLNAGFLLGYSKLQGSDFRYPLTMI